MFFSQYSNCTVFTSFFLIHLVPAKVENGHALRKNVQELALFMEVVTTPHLIRKHMHFKDSVAILL